MENKPDMTTKMDTNEGIILIAFVGIDDETYKRVTSSMNPRAGYGFVRLDDISQVDGCYFGVPEVVLVPDSLEITSLPEKGSEILTVTNSIVTEKGDNRLSLSGEEKMIVRGRGISYLQDSIDIITEVALAKRRKSLLEKYSNDLDEILNNGNGIDTNRLIELFASKDVVALGHIKMVAEFSEVLADGMELSEITTSLTEQERSDFRTIALVHDIGKLVTPDQLLKNEDAFSSKEFSSMQQHVDISLTLAKSEKTQELLGLALKHHYRYDGRGYLVQSPEEIGDNIPQVARMLAVIDAFDAICDPGRKYQNNDPAESLVAKAVNILYTNSQEQSKEFPFGGQFDPKIAHAFLLGFQHKFATDEKFRMDIIGRELHTDDPTKIEERRTQIEDCLDSVINRFGYNQEKVA